MTWIIGTSAFWGAAILISDIRVTFKNPNGRKEYDDCLQKIYPLGCQVIGGFSGSVNLGFGILDEFKHTISKLSNNTLCNINSVAITRWPRIAKRIFSKGDPQDTNLGCSIIIASAHPTHNIGDTPLASTNIYIFKSPDFKPIKIERNKVESIGYGSGIKEYGNFLTKIQRDRSLIQLGANTPKMLAFVISNRIRQMVEKFPKAAISKYVQFGIVNRQEATIKNLEFIQHERDGSVTEFKLPHLVQGKEEFLAYWNSRSMSAHGATC